MVTVVCMISYIQREIIGNNPGGIYSADYTDGGVTFVSLSEKKKIINKQTKIPVIFQNELWLEAVP